MRLIRGFRVSLQYRAHLQNSFRTYLSLGKLRQSVFKTRSTSLSATTALAPFPSPLSSSFVQASKLPVVKETMAKTEKSMSRLRIFQLPKQTNHEYQLLLDLHLRLVHARPALPVLRGTSSWT